MSIDEYMDALKQYNRLYDIVDYFEKVYCDPDLNRGKYVGECRFFDDHVWMMIHSYDAFSRDDGFELEVPIDIFLGDVSVWKAWIKDMEK